MAIPVLRSDLFHLNISPEALQRLATVPSKMPANETLITRVVSISQANYDAIVAKDPNTLYVVPET